MGFRPKGYLNIAASGPSPGPCPGLGPFVAASYRHGQASIAANSTAANSTGKFFLGLLLVAPAILIAAAVYIVML